MELPGYVLTCLRRLEAAGFPTYAVGGCVRDYLLGLTPHDYDLCTAATPHEIKAVFSDHALVLAGEKHGPVGVITDTGVVEITAFRTEGEYRDHRHPDRVDFVTDITQDLARRDFTVNAMGWSPTRGLADPFGGQTDLQQRCLRAVGDPARRFREDALRILRGVRFSAAYDLTPEPATEAAMHTLSPLMDNLARERVFDELCKLLVAADAADLLRWQGVLTQLLPELQPAVDFHQHSRFHAHDVYTHIAHTVEAAPKTLPLRWAALLHDIGKPSVFSLDDDGEGHFYGHTKVSAQIADDILYRLKAPTALRQQVVFLIEQHMTPLLPDRKLLRRRLSQYGPEAVEQLLMLQVADHVGTGLPGDAPDYAQTQLLLQQLVAEDACLTVQKLAVNGHDLIKLGYTGPAIGKALQWLLEQVLEEAVPNERQALLLALTSKGDMPL